jgi:hypothetical protein
MDDTSQTPQPITPGERRLVISLAAGLSLIFILIGAWCWVTIRQNKIAEDQRIQAIIESPTIQVGVPYNEAPPPGLQVEPSEVEVGLYLNQIPSFSLKDSAWVADFFIWFRWQGELPDPGETFSILDSTILSREMVAESHAGATHYTRYHVVAQVYKFFDVSRFPLSEIILTIPIMDLQHPVYELRYLADQENTGVSTRVNILEGINITDSEALVKLYTFQTDFSDPTFPDGYHPAFSTFLYGIWVSSPGLMYYFKLFLALLVSGLIAISVFFIKPTDVDPRFGLGVGALFAASASAYVIASAMPPSGGLVLADMVNVIGIMVIFLTIMESILSLYFYDIQDKQALSRWMDKVMIVVFTLGFLAMNIIIPLAALV